MTGALPPFSVTTVRTAEHTVLFVSGEMDIATADEFTVAAREQLATGPVVLDLHDLSFMDSCGLRALIGLLRQREQEGWSLAVGSNLHSNVKQLLEMTGMLGELPLQDQELTPEPPRTP
jgi:anti-anti-sigma factor